MNSVWFIIGPLTHSATIDHIVWFAVFTKTSSDPKSLSDSAEKNELIRGLFT